MGAVMGQFMFQFVQFGPRFVISTADTSHFLDVFRCCIQVVVLIALPHQSGLILEFGFLQFSTAVGYLLTQGSVAKSCNNLTFPDFLSAILYGEHDNLFSDTTIDRNLAHCFYLTLDSC